MVCITNLNQTKKMEKILVCLQHLLTQDQLDSLKGFDVVYLKDVNPDLFAKVANTPATAVELKKLAQEYSQYVMVNYGKAIVPIGSPAFQFLVAQEFANQGTVELWFAHSERSSVDETQPDGSVVKRAVFRHVDWIKIQ